MGLVLIAVFMALVVALFVLAIIEASLLHLRRSPVAAGSDPEDHRDQEPTGTRPTWSPSENSGTSPARPRLPARSNPRTPVSDVERRAPHIGHRAPVIDVLRTMQSTSRHLGIVEDDNGCTIGILTVEDIVEELVGSIHEPPPGAQDTAERDVDPTAKPATKEDT